MVLLPLILAVILLAVVIWIIIPAPNRMLWLISIGVGEWSLWFGALALICIAASLIDRLVIGTPWIWIGTIAVGAAVISIALYPLFSVLPLARKNRIPLSLRRYFSNIPAYDFFAGYRRQNFSTHVFGSSDGRDLQLDAFRPAIEKSNGANIIVVHGGSWNGGVRNDFPRWNTWLAARGFTVFDIDYTLTPQPNYIMAVADIKAAVRWVKANAAEFEIDPDSIVLMGRSAGAHLALQAAYTADGESEKVCAAISFYGPVDLLWAYGVRGNKKVHDGPGSLINFLGGRPDDSAEIRERYISTSPISHVTENTPPTFMVHGTRDRLVYWKNMERLDAKLSAAQIPHEIYLIPHGQHGFDYNINGWASQFAGAAILRFLARYTRPNF